MRRHAANRFVILKVVTKLGAIGVVFVCARRKFAAKQTFSPQPFAQALHQASVFGPAFAQQVAHAVEHSSNSCEVSPFDFSCWQDEGLCLGIGVERGVGKQFVRQGFEPRLFGDHAFGAALGLVGQVQVF